MEQGSTEEMGERMNEQRFLEAIRQLSHLEDEVLTVAFRIANYPAFDPHSGVPWGFWRDINELRDAANKLYGVERQGGSEG